MSDYGRAKGHHKVILVKGGRGKIRADYAGGAYIDLTFGSEGYRPTEVINVYDYAEGKVTGPLARYWNNLPENDDDDQGMTDKEFGEAIREIVRDWIKSNEEEGWLGWYEDYVANQ